MLEGTNDAIIAAATTTSTTNPNSSDSTTITRKSNDDLQQDAKTFFKYISRNTQIDTGSGVILQTRSSHEEALARLIQECLQPAFTPTTEDSTTTTIQHSNTYPVKYRALHLLLGAIEGCCSTETGISNTCLDLLGNFLTVQCGPIVDDDDYEEDYDTLIRDISLKCLSALIDTPTATTTTTTTTNSEEELVVALEKRSDFAVVGVERRCAAPDDMDADGIDSHGFGNPRIRDIRGGLSMLPRSKRSLCFDLLRCAVTGISKVNSQIQLSSSSSSTTTPVSSSILMSNAQRKLVQFTEFATRCIPGESDPRCLLQLLELLHTIQSAFQSWFLTVERPSNVFPNEDVFESVVPYYPIQFTPPPNNVHGITREGLHYELISVLTFTETDKSARQHSRPTMLESTLGLFLEQLLPSQPDEENPSPLEKFEALECLSTLLLPKGSDNELKNLTSNEVRALATALRATHDEASLGVTEGGAKVDQYKALADSCRSFVANVAWELEKTEIKGLWETFVLEPLDKDVKRLQLSPGYAKITIAYEACLAASGGPRTLRSCLMKGLEPLLKYLEDNLEDSEDSLAAIHGLSAFFSSSRVTIDKSKKLGVELSPHPLEPYAAKSCSLLLTVIEKQDSPYSFQLRAAATTALECVFLACSASQLAETELLNRTCTFVKNLLQTVTVEEISSEDQEQFLAYQYTASRVLGVIIGNTMISGENVPSSSEIGESIFQCKQLQDCVANDVFPTLKASAFKVSEKATGDRYDRRALAIASSTDMKLAETVVMASLTSFLEALENSLTASDTFARLEALSYIIRNSEGDNVIRAFHESDVVDKILDALSCELIAGTSARLRTSIAQVALPATAEENRVLLSKVRFMFCFLCEREIPVLTLKPHTTLFLQIQSITKIENNLLPAYNKLVPRERLAKLLAEVSKKIPPLSKADEGDLFVRLPILAASLQSVEASVLQGIIGEAAENETDFASQLLNGLADYATSSEHLPTGRTAAASCVHALIKKGFARGGACPVKPLVAKISGSLATSTGNISVTTNTINFLSLLVSTTLNFSRYWLFVNYFLTVYVYNRVHRRHFEVLPRLRLQMLLLDFLWKLHAKEKQSYRVSLILQKNL